MHANVFKIQLACSACLYNLTKIGWPDDDSFGIPLTLMSEVAQLTLDAMNSYPKHPQLQKNALLILCNDRILQVIAKFSTSVVGYASITEYQFVFFAYIFQNTNMDRVRCAKLVLNALCTFREESIQKLCVAISSIVGE